MTLENFEKSRAGKVHSINHAVPNQQLNNLKSDKKRRKSFEKHQKYVNAMNGNQPTDFYDRNEKEFFDILKRIERLKKHKLKEKQTQNNEMAQDASKTAINAVEERLQKVQLDLDVKKAIPVKQATPAAAMNKNAG